MSGLAVAFRSSRRNLRRHRGRNALIAAMVSLPVTVMVAVGITHSSQEPTTSELLSAELGNAQARIQVVAGPTDKILQSPDNPGLSWAAADENAHPGIAAPSQLDPSVPGASTALKLISAQVGVTTAAADLRIAAIVGAAWDQLLEGRYALVSGRPPTASDEVMLSPGAASRLSLAVGDTFSVDDHEVTVVGTLAQPQGPDEQVFIPAGLIDATGPEATTEWYTATELSWDQVKALNEQGIVAYSRDVVEHPPGEDPLAAMRANTSDSSAVIVAIAFGGGAIAILLAGSAFAVGLRREQRVLGMFAVTGADRRHVAAISIATGFWLGLLGGALGIAVGTTIAWALQQIARTWSGASSVLGYAQYWGFHLPTLQLVGALVFAVVVGAASAAIPAVMASRRDPLVSLRGALRPRRLSRRWATAGLVAVGLGVAGLIFGRHALAARLASPGAWNGAGAWPLLIAAAAIAAFAGVVLVMPAFLASIARLGAHAPLAARLAFRDGARQSMRTVGVIVAISVSVLAVTVTASLATQSANVAVAKFWSWSPVGTLRIDLVDSDSEGALTQADPADALAAVRTVNPAASTFVLEGFPDSGFYQNVENPPATGISVLIPKQNRCPAFHQGDDDMSQAQLSTDIRCSQWEQMAFFSGAVGHVVVGDAADLEALLNKPASTEALAALDQGGAVLLSRAYLDGSSVKLGIWDQASGNWPVSEDGTEPVPRHAITLPAVVDDPSPTPITPFAVVISPETAATLGMEPLPSVVLATAPGGFTQQQADSVQAALHRTGNLNVYFSAGPEPDINLQFIVILAIGLLILTIAASGISIGIARADARNDDSTLMSVGAPPGITRLVAMWQALFTVALAALMGVGLGLAVAWALSPLMPGAPFVMPTTLVVAVVIGLPALMALGAVAFTRPARVTAYRLAA